MPSLLIDHLWQSTGFALGAAILAHALRRNGAAVRYVLWCAASLKFLIPFVALVMVGAALPWRPASPAIPSAVVVAVSSVASPFGGVAAFVVDAPAFEATGAASWTMVLALVWVAGTAAFAFTAWRKWQRAAIVVRSASIIDHGPQVDVVHRVAAAMAVTPPPLAMCDDDVEPGVFGILRPVLVWPRRIAAHLTPAQVEAIFAHELCHVRRRDNLTAALHTAVQAIFWFHPLVWWIGARLIEERERACDEAVLHLGGEPHVYAAGILRTCEHCLGSPTSAVAGVTGPDLRRRIEAIVRGTAPVAMTRARKALLGLAAGTLVATPVAAGALIVSPISFRSAPPAAPSVAFESTSIERNTLGVPMMRNDLQPGSPWVMGNGLDGPEEPEARQIADREFGEATASRDPEVQLRALRVSAARFAPAQRNGPEVYTEADGVVMPKVVRDVKPTYSPTAMQEQIEGDVLLSVVVLASGAVGDIVVTQSLDDSDGGLDARAVEAMKQWTFEPGTKDGQPVAVRVMVQMRFTLR